MTSTRISRREALKSLPLAAGMISLTPLEEKTSETGSAQSGLKITDVKVLINKEKSPKYVLVKIITDGGIEGVGEASRMMPYVTREMIHRQFRPLLIGEDPINVEALYWKMHINTYKFEGRSQALAISGIELALLDLKGKAFGVPVYQLLGGAIRTKIPVYASFDHDEPIKLARAAEKCLAANGYCGVKLQVATRWGFSTQPDNTLDCVKEVRAAIGDDVDLIVDPIEGWTTQYAIEMCKKLEPYNIKHIEQPVPERDLDALEAVTKSTNIQIGFGELDYNLWRYKDVLTRRLGDVTQPDPIKAGGLINCIKIAHLAEAFSKPIVRHNTSQVLRMAAVLRLCASIPNARHPQECVIFPEKAVQGTRQHRRVKDLYSNLLNEKYLIVDGHIEVPKTPGLGFTLNESVIKKYLYEAYHLPLYTSDILRLWL